MSRAEAARAAGIEHQSLRCCPALQRRGGLAGRSATSLEVILPGSAKASRRSWRPMSCGSLVRSAASPQAGHCWTYAASLRSASARAGVRNPCRRSCAVWGRPVRKPDRFIPSTIPRPPKPSQRGVRQCCKNCDRRSSRRAHGTLVHGQGPGLDIRAAPVTLVGKRPTSARNHPNRLA